MLGEKMADQMPLNSLGEGSSGYKVVQQIFWSVTLVSFFPFPSFSYIFVKQAQVNSVYPNQYVLVEHCSTVCLSARFGKKSLLE